MSSGSHDCEGFGNTLKAKINYGIEILKSDGVQRAFGGKQIPSSEDAGPERNIWARSPWRKGKKTTRGAVNAVWSKNPRTVAPSWR